MDLGERGDRDGSRGPRRVVTAILLIGTAVTFLVGVVALVVGLAGGSHDHGAVLVAGRMASSASVLAVVSWCGSRDARTTRTDGTPPRGTSH